MHYQVFYVPAAVVTEFVSHLCFDFIAGSLETLKFIGAYHGDEMIGFGAVEPSTGDIPQIAVSAAHRRRGVGTLIFTHLMSAIEVEVVKVTNVDVRCESLIAFLEYAGLPNAGGQYEMQLLL